MLTMLAAQNWGLFVLRGVLAIILGVFAFLQPGATLAALVLLFAAYATIDGIFAIGAGLGAPGGPRWWVVIAGIVGLALGIYTFLNPSITAVALVIVFGIFSLVRGVAEIVTAIQLRSVIEYEWVWILSGVVSAIFGAYLVVQPGNGALALLWLIGYYAILAGILYIVMGFRLRGIAKSVQPDTSRAPASS
jgi:uncharacterized membrane protein HdeD (DUF308 family)